MGVNCTILFAREDLTIPGAAADAALVADEAGSIQARFFELVRGREPDVIVLDFSRAPPTGIDTILRVRERTAVPILLVCNPDEKVAEDYRMAGAAGCIPAPIDIMRLHRAVERILKLRARAEPPAGRPPASFQSARVIGSAQRPPLKGEAGSLADASDGISRPNA